MEPKSAHGTGSAALRRAGILVFPLVAATAGFYFDGVAITNDALT
jgi:hypothetical protein